MGLSSSTWRCLPPDYFVGKLAGAARDPGGKMTRVLVCLLCLAASLAAQSAVSSARGDESLLLALENAWNQAQLQHDSKALDELVAETFVSTDNDGAFE